MQVKPCSNLTHIAIANLVKTLLWGSGDAPQQRSRSKRNGYRTILAATVIGLGVAGSAQPGWSHQRLLSVDPVESTHIVYNIPHPPDQGAPDGRQRGGASRGPCQSFEPLTALVPTTAGAVWGLTAAAHPTFLFYLPPALDEGTVVEFTLQDANDDYVYQTQLNAPTSQASLVQVTVPDTAAALAVDQSYVWTLAVYCDPLHPARSVFVTGTIQRTDLAVDVQEAIAQAEPLQQAQLYAEQGIWHEALATLAHQIHTNPTDTQAVQAWEMLLHQTALQDVTDVPLAITQAD